MWHCDASIYFTRWGCFKGTLRLDEKCRGNAKDLRSHLIGAATMAMSGTCPCLNYTDPEILPRLGPKMARARQNFCSKHVLISFRLHLDTRRRIRNFPLNRDRPWLSWELSQSWGLYAPCHPPWLGPDRCWDDNPLDATTDDVVSVSPSHSILSLIPLMGTNWRHKKRSQKTWAFQLFVFQIN